MQSPDDRHPGRRQVVGQQRIVEIITVQVVQLHEVRAKRLDVRNQGLRHATRRQSVAVQQQALQLMEQDIFLPAHHVMAQGRCMRVFGAVGHAALAAGRFHGQADLLGDPAGRAIVQDRIDLIESHGLPNFFLCAP